MPHAVLILLALLLPAGATLAQRPNREPADARTIQRRETAVQEALAARDAALVELRASYRRLEEHLAGVSDADQAKLEADVARVLEAPMDEARTALAGRTSERRRARSRFDKALSGLASRVEVTPLPVLGGWLEARVATLIDEGGDFAAAMELPPADIARRVLAPALDGSVPFHQRWNDHLHDQMPAATTWSKACATLEEAQNALMIARDPLLAFTVGAPEGYARVPSGSYQILNLHGFAGMGSRKWKSRTVRLDQGVDIALHEVTNGEYFEWYKTLGAADRQDHLPRDAGNKPIWQAGLDTGNHEPTKDQRNQPVRGIRFTSAMAFALHHDARLPTEEEWCAMAGGPGKERDIPAFPWGDAWIPDHCSSAELELQAPMAVGAFPNGRGPYGHYDVAGNVSEWLMTDFDSGKTLDPADLDGKNAVVRGGSFRGGHNEVAVGWVWYRRASFDRDETTGFRLARDVKPE